MMIVFKNVESGVFSDILIIRRQVQMDTGQNFSVSGRKVLQSMMNIIMFN
jgi:hypothetical protein